MNLEAPSRLLDREAELSLLVLLCRQHRRPPFIDVSIAVDRERGIGEYADLSCGLCAGSTWLLRMRGRLARTPAYAPHRDEAG
jgi:hypothetical protein